MCVCVVVCLFDFCFCLVYARFFIAASICVHFAVPPAPLLLPVVIVVVVVVRVLVAFVLISLFPFTSTLSLSLSLFTFCHKWRLIYQFVCLPMEFISPSVPSPSSSSTTFSLCHPQYPSLSLPASLHTVFSIVSGFNLLFIYHHHHRRCYFYRSLSLSLSPSVFHLALSSSHLTEVQSVAMNFVTLSQFFLFLMYL